MTDRPADKNFRTTKKSFPRPYLDLVDEVSPAQNTGERPTVERPEIAPPPPKFSIKGLARLVNDEHLREQLLELERREQRLSEQLTQFDREQRNFRLTQQDFDEETERAKSKLRAEQVELKRRNGELDEKLSRCDEILSEMEAQQAELTASREEFEEEKNSYLEQARKEALVALDSERAEIQADRNALRQRTSQIEAEQSQVLAELRQSWEAERAELRRKLTAKLSEELQADRALFEEEKNRFEARCEAERAELEHERELHDRALQRAREELDQREVAIEKEADQRRDALEVELDQRRKEVEAELQAARENWDAQCEERDVALRQKYAVEAEALENERELLETHKQAEQIRLDAERQQWAEELAAQQEELTNFKSTLQVEINEQRQEIESQRSGLAEELAAERAKHDQQLERERLAFEQERDAAQLVLEEEREVMENRFHFREEHLKKTQEELEIARDELNRRVQAGQAYAAELARQHKLRLDQLDKFRNNLEQREESVQREHSVLFEMRSAFIEQKSTQSERFAVDRANWERQRDVDHSEIEQQRTQLAARTEELSARQQRLDHLREELDQTHRENLELRVAVEEAWVELTRKAGTEDAQRRIATARKQVVEHFDRQEDLLRKDRQRLSTERAAIDQMTTQLEEQRRSLADWYREREGILLQREEQLAQQTKSRDAREKLWTQLQQRWLDEKAKAEKIIRELLGKIDSGEFTPRLQTEQHLSSLTHAAEEVTPEEGYEDPGPNLKIHAA
ncbi:coiled-coil domain-containing protein [Calycomorphotria hydatis]|uniref:Uncharacterized protein n=1 Tax=Calycomorphotria hydatis TaxID=2528027 RepID=A0A517T3J0_9PLAN|nr:hypothetical protein [Calycomorphotria hydatis]QDT62945.1 hypothetical protein V22_01430 [Calycomorphotria hydatis]